MKQADKAVAAIDAHGMLLVYPLQNKKAPRALWHVLHPRSEMRWAWDADADPRVAAMWHLREMLARDRRVVYSKWLGGRATFFSLDLFVAMLATLRAGGDPKTGLSADASTLLELVSDNSPQSTRALREGAGLGGRLYETAFQRAMRSLWERLLILGVGEVEAGGFPALSVGATELLREDLWQDAEGLKRAHEERIVRAQQSSPAFARAWARVVRNVVGHKDAHA